MSQISLRNDKAYSIPGRPKPDQITRWRSAIPGPGTYDLTRTSQKPRGLVWPNPPSKEPSTDTLDDLETMETPGPGHYNPKTSAFKKGGGVKLLWKLPEKSKGLLPGPGDYEAPLDKIKSKSPAFSMVDRRTRDEISLNPSPDAYNFDVSVLKPKVTGGKFSTADSRFHHREIEEESPGPGEYRIQSFSMRKRGTKFAYLTKTDMRKNSTDFAIPGPGSYDISSSFASPEYYEQSVITIGGVKKGVTFGGKTDTKDRGSSAPPVGSYDLDKYGRIGVGVIGGKISTSRVKANEDSRMSKGSINSAGPGSYDPNYNAVKKRGGKVLLLGKPSDSARHYQALKAPGPGYYELDSEKKESKKAKEAKVPFGSGDSMRFKNDFIPILTPGAGSYDPSLSLIRKRSQVTIMGSEEKLRKRRNSELPGPGTYHKKLYDLGKMGKGTHFPQSIRKAIPSDNPLGPGHYDIPSTIPKVPKYLMYQSKPKITLEQFQKSQIQTIKSNK